MNFCYLLIVLLAYRHETNADTAIFGLNFTNTLQDEMDYLKLLGSNFWKGTTMSPFLSDTHADQCVQSLKQIKDDIKLLKVYALKIHDAWGKIGSGVLQGNVYWPGRYYECVNTHGDNFSGKYFQVYIKRHKHGGLFGLNLTNGITVGYCFPDTCRDDTIQSLFSPLSEKLFTLFYFPKQYEEWEARDISGLCLLVVFILLVLSSTLYEYIRNRIDETMNDFAKVSVEGSPLLPTTHQSHHGFPRRLLMSFSLIANTKRLLDIRQKPIEITCLHGIRFLSMTWIIVGHSFYLLLPQTDNQVEGSNYYSHNWHAQLLGLNFFAVDTFFFLSGLLVMYVKLLKLQRESGKFNLHLMYLNRYIRLTPAYAFTLFMLVSVFPKLGNGPFWTLLVEDMQTKCQKYWYTNLLYVNNLYPGDLDSMCMGWGWYLSADLQFFILSPLFIYLLYKYQRLGLAASILTITASVVLTGVFSIFMYRDTLLEGFLGVTLQNDVSYQPHYIPYLYDVYTKPWCRIGAYIVGLLSGYVLHTYKMIKISKLVVLASWTMASAISCAILFMYYAILFSPEHVSGNVVAFYSAASRPLWCVGLAWLTVACTNGYGGPINNFLSWKGFIPLSKLTYCTYLIHPVVITWFTANQETLFHFSIPTVIMLFFATLVLSHLLAYVIAMLTEFPMLKLISILQDKRNTRTPDGVEVTPS